MAGLMKLYGEQFAYKEPPYEYEFEKLPIEMILGSRKVCEALQSGAEPGELVEGWQHDIDGFAQLRKEFFLYWKKEWLFVLENTIKIVCLAKIRETEVQSHLTYLFNVGQFGRLGLFTKRSKFIRRTVNSNAQIPFFQE